MGQQDTDKETFSVEELKGELVDLRDLAQIFNYPSIAAVRKAYSRSTLPVKLYKFESRKGMYAKLTEVKESIENMQEC